MPIRESNLNANMAVALGKAHATHFNGVWNDRSRYKRTQHTSEYTNRLGGNRGARTGSLRFAICGCAGLLCWGMAITGVSPSPRYVILMGFFCPLAHPTHHPEQF